MFLKNVDMYTHNILTVVSGARRTAVCHREMIIAKNATPNKMVEIYGNSNVWVVFGVCTWGISDIGSTGEEFR